MTSDSSVRSMAPRDLFSQLYDPVFQVEGAAVPQESLWTLLSPIERERLGLFRRVMTSPELQRLKSLRKAGFAGFVFPAATHTRFAHAVGTWSLGRMAMDYVHVKTANGVASLRRYLEQSDDVEEFLTALLVQDVGSPPFSHVLLGNDDFILGLNRILGQKPGGSPHENVSRWIRCQILGGGGRADVDELLDDQHAAGGAGETLEPVSRLAPLLREYQKPGESAPVVADLDDIRILLGCSSQCGITRPETRRNLEMIRGIVEGVAALDRLDGYNRDSFYTGAGISSVHVVGLLRHLILDVTNDPPVIEVWEEEGVWHAMELLLLRHSLWKRVYDHPEIRAYDAMLSAAISKSLRSGSLSVPQMLFLEDADLLDAMQRDPNCHDLVHRIKRKRPYVTAHVGVFDDPRHAAERFETWRSQRALDARDDFLLGLPHVWSLEATEWLEGLAVVQGDAFGVSGHSPGQSRLREREAKLCDYLARERSERQRTVMIFARTRELAAQHGTEISRILSSPGVVS